MVEMPKELRGCPVIRSVQYATDESQVPFYGTIMTKAGVDVFNVHDIFSRNGEWWDSENGAYDLNAWEAEQLFSERCAARNRFTRMIMEGKCTWLAVAMMRWDYIPVSGRDEFTVYARDAAGKARDFEEFYRPENRKKATAIERWLTRYSAEHTHPDLRD